MRCTSPDLFTDSNVFQYGQTGQGMDASSVSNDSPDYLRGRSWSLVCNLTKSFWLLPVRYHIEAH
jgi:hypothetical protein